MVIKSTITCDHFDPAKVTLYVKQSSLKKVELNSLWEAKASLPTPQKNSTLADALIKREDI